VLAVDPAVVDAALKEHDGLPTVIEQSAKWLE